MNWVENLTDGLCALIGNERKNVEIEGDLSHSMRRLCLISLTFLIEYALEFRLQRVKVL